jgi:porphyrinogen peroxidase
VIKTSLPVQPSILAAVPRAASYLFLRRKAGVKPAAALKTLRTLAGLVSGEDTVLGVGSILMNTLERPVADLRAFPVIAGAKVDLPISQSDIALWVRGVDAGEVFHRTRHWQRLAAPAFETDSVWNAFRHQTGHDLTGFEDGTENPKGRAAIAAALVGEGPMAGSSFLALQPWVHQFDQFDALKPTARNHVIGRDLVSNEELDDAPASAHVKRTAQEAFSPEAFVLRRSMPWARDNRAGLMFAAFGRSFDAFEAQLTRMCGAEDGVVDALFSISRPIGGGYYWCPPKSPQSGLILP